MLALGFFLVCRSFLLGSLAFPLSLERLLFSRLLLGCLTFPLSFLQRLLFCCSFLLLGCLTFPLSFLQRLLFCCSFLLLGCLTFALSLLQGLLSLLSLLSLSRFLLLSSFSLLLFLLSLRLVPLRALVELDHVASCLIKHVMGVDQFNGCHIERACGQEGGDKYERSDTPRSAPRPSVQIIAYLISQRCLEPLAEVGTGPGQSGPN